MGDRRDPPDTRPSAAPRRPPRPDAALAEPAGDLPGPAGLIIHDASGRITAATDRALELLGVTLNQLRADIPRPPVWTFTDADGEALDPEQLPPFAVVRAGRAVDGGLVAIDDGSPDGRRWLRLAVDEVRDDLGHVERLITSVHDVSTERRARVVNEAGAALAAAAARAEPGAVAPLVSEILATLGGACEAAWVTHVTLDRAAGRASLADQWSATGTGWPYHERSAPIDLFARFLRHLSRGRPVVIPDMRTVIESDWARDQLDQWGMRSGASAPVMVGGRLEGFLAISWNRPRRIPREQADLLMLAADLLASATVLARLGSEVAALRGQHAEQVAAAARRAELYADVSPDVVLEIDEEDRLVDMVLPATYQSTFLVQLRGHSVLDAFDGGHRERLAAVLRAVRAGSPMEVFEFEWATPTGTRSYEARFTATAEGRIVVVTRDVTGRARSPAAGAPADALALANEELARLVHERDRFLASVSHELRTPLNAILGLTEMLLEGRAEPLTTIQSSTLRTIESSGRHLLELINDLLDLSRLRADAVRLELRDVPVEEPCRLTFDLVRPRALALGVHVELADIPPGLRIRADERRLRQVLINLMDNAVSFTEPGGTAGLEVGQPDPDHVALSVWDTGTGIAAPDQTRIFEPFTQLGGRRDGRRAGSGLGLSVVERLVSLHQGHIEVDSAPGRGSRFTVVLPVAGPTGADGDGAAAGRAAGRPVVVTARSVDDIPPR